MNKVQRGPPGPAAAQAVPASTDVALEAVPLYAALAVAAVALPLVLIRHLSLWFDELFSVYFAGQGPAYLLQDGWAKETSPPLYYLVLWFWTGLFGRGEAAARAPSLLAHVATLPVVFAIARRLGLRNAAWPAVVLYAFGAATVEQALMVRAYALWTLFQALAMLALVSGIRTLAAPAPGIDRRCLLSGAGFVAASLAAFYTHNVTVVFVAAADAIFLAAWWWQRGRTWHGLAAWFGPQLAGLLLAVPQFLVIAQQAYSHNIDWIPRLTPMSALAVLVELFGGPPYPLMLLRTIVAAVVLGLFLWGAAAAIRRRSPAVPLVVLAVAGYALLCLVSAWRPILLARTALWLMVPVSIVIAAALVGIRGRVIRLAAVLAVVVLFAANSGLGTWLSWQEPWREIVKVLADHKQPNDVIVVMDGTPITAFFYYAPGAASWDIRHWDTARDPTRTGAVRALEDRIAPPTETAPREMAALLRQGRAIWLVSRQGTSIPLHEAFDTQALPGTTPSIQLQRGTIILSRLAQPGH